MYVYAPNAYSAYSARGGHGSLELELHTAESPHVGAWTEPQSSAGAVGL